MDLVYYDADFLVKTYSFREPLEVLTYSNYLSDNSYMIGAVQGFHYFMERPFNQSSPGDPKR